MPWDAIGAVAGIVGVLVAIVLGVMQFSQWSRERKPGGPTVGSAVSDAPTTLIVETTNGALTFGPNLSPWMVVIKVANPAPRPFKITGFGLYIEGTTKHLAWLSPGLERPLPLTLKETEQTHAWVSHKEVGASLVRAGFDQEKIRIRGYVHDSYGGKHTGDWLTARPQEWARAKE